MDKIITLDEVKKHCNKSSVWMVIHNNVYDVTSFLEEHPGGEESLMEVAGKDGTQDFEDVGHSDDARELLKKYKIGSLPPEQKTTFIESSCCKLKKKKSSRNSSQCSMCSAKSCPSLPKMDKHEKTWRTFDGSSASKPLEKKPEASAPPTPRAERRVQSIVVPRERCKSRRTRSASPPPDSSKLKWAVIALAGAVVIGFALKKYLNK